MKKLLAILLALVFVLSLAACGGEPDASEPGKAENTGNAGESTGTNGGETEGEAYTFTYGELKMAVNAPAAPYIEALGEPMSYTAEESCAFDGEDKTYYYGSFYLQTYPMNGEDRVYCLWLVDDTVATEEGVYIGSTQEQVEQAYGAQWYNGSNAYTVKSGDCNLLILLENGAVTSIQYMAVVE